MNGTVVALVLVRLFPDHEQQILARGLRYGDNRVACGVHHVTDVEQGRLLGVAYWQAVEQAPAFLDDIACAREEEAAHGPTGTALSAHCRSKLRNAAPLKKSTM
jgi:acid phosphatase (class A)